MPAPPGPRRRPELWVSRFADETVVVDRLTSRAHLLDGPAALVWDLLDGRSVDEIVADVRRADDTMAGAVETVVGHLAAQGLLDHGRPVDAPRPRAERLESAGTSDAVVPPDGTTLRGRSVGPIVVGDARLWVRSEAGDVLDAVERAFGPWAGEQELDTGAVHDVVVRHERDAYVVTFSDATALRAVNPGDVVATIVWFAQRRVLAAQRPGVALHGAAVARAGEVLAVLGASGAGKSTVAAAAAASGWTLVSDEVVLLDPSGTDVAVAPLPIKLDAAGARMVSAVDLVGSLRVEHTTSGSHLVTVPPERRAQGRRMPLAGFVFLSGPGTASSDCSEDWSPARTLLGLVEHLLESSQLGDRALETLEQAALAVPGCSLERTTLAGSLTVLEQRL